MRANTANEGDLALVYNINNLQGLFQYTNNNWEIAPTGLTTTNEYVVDSIFWGANGVEQGTLQVNTDLTTDQVKIKAQVYNDLSYLELDPSITSLANAFRSVMAFRANLKNVPNFNTSNVTNMLYMFTGQSNLLSVPDLDTSNVINMAGMFDSCRNLICAPNFNYNKVVSTAGMYRSCSNLINVPSLEMPKVTNISSMFWDCHSLTNISTINAPNVINAYGLFLACYNLIDVAELNFPNAQSIAMMFDDCKNLVNAPNINAPNVTSMHALYVNCTNLANIPEFNTNKVTYMTNIFLNCNNLSSPSYANIANSLPNASQLTNQYISNIGLNVNKFTTEQLTILNQKGYVDAII